MKTHQVIFQNIKELLNTHLKEIIEEHEEGSYISIGDSGIWISCDDRELSVGYGFSHTHYDPEYDNLLEPINDFFNLLTKRKRVTVYYKGNFQYKSKTEIELDNESFKYLARSITWLFPYWKKTTTKKMFTDKILDESIIKQDINRMKNMYNRLYDIIA